MSLDRNIDGIDHQLGVFDSDDYEPDTARSNFASFLIGGVVVAGGLLAFLFYDGGSFNHNRDFMDAGSLSAVQTPAAPTLADRGNSAAR